MTKIQTENYHKYIQNSFGQNSHSICTQTDFFFLATGPEEQYLFCGQIFINENIVSILFVPAKAVSFFFFSFFGGWAYERL